MQCQLHILNLGWDSTFSDLFERQSGKREREGAGERTSTLGFFPNVYTSWGWATAARSLGFLTGFPRVFMRLSTWAVFCFFPGHVSRDVDQKQNSWILELTPTWNASVAFTGYTSMPHGVRFL